MKRTKRMTRSTICIVMTFMLLFAPAAPALAATKNWTRAGEASWVVGTNWSGGSAPGAADDALINNGGRALIGAGDDVDIGSVAIGSGASTSGRLTINSSSGSLTTTGGVYVGRDGGTGTLNLNNGASMTVGGGLDVGVDSGSAATSGTVNIQNGSTLTTTGAVTIGSGSHINAVGSVTVDGAGSLLDSGSADIILGGATGGRGSLSVTNDGAVQTTGNISIGDSSSLYLGGSLGTLSGSSYTYAGNIAIAQDAVFEFDSNTGHLFSGNITGPGTLVVQKNRTLELGGGIASNLALHEGSTFTFTSLSLSDNAIPTLEVRGTGVTWDGRLQMLAGKTLNFYVPPSMAAGQTMLTVAGLTNITGATVGVGIDGGNPLLQPGDSITLIDALGLRSDHDGTKAAGIQGISTLYEFDLSVLGNKLNATVAGSGQNPQLKSLAESHVASVGMLTQGADLLSTQGIGQLRASAAKGIPGPATFGVMGGGSIRYNSGSHVDVDGFNLAAGFGWNFPLNEGKNGNLLAGAFFEAGWGSYDSHNSFGNAASVNGDGNTNYYGGGILTRYDTAPVGPGNVYLEASGRAGKVDTDYSSDGFRTASGREVSFDSSAAYYGAHAGVGYIWNITEKSSLDVYTKYLWTHQEDDSVTIQGDDIHFKAMDSHRLRGGARFSHAITTDSGFSLAPYIGAAYEHEFDSKARATSNGNAIKAPDLKGGTGIGEIGLTFKPSAAMPLSFDLGVQGYAGKREGVTGSLQIKFEF